MQRRNGTRRNFAPRNAVRRILRDSQAAQVQPKVTATGSIFARCFITPGKSCLFYYNLKLTLSFTEGSRKAPYLQISEECCQGEIDFPQENSPPPPAQFSNTFLTTPPLSLLPPAASCVWPRPPGRRSRCTPPAPSSSDR